MENSGKINLTSSEFEKIKSKLFAEGTDAHLYVAGSNSLYKIFKDEHKVISYMTDDRTSASDDEIIEMLRRKQANIKFTDLPKALVYIDGKLSGVVLKQQKRCFELRTIWGFLPKTSKVILLKRILGILKELTDNYIYPTDLDNIKEFGRKNSHCNILIDLWHLTPRMIDLDGHSTSYYQSESVSMKHASYSSLNDMIVNLIFDIDILEEDIETALRNAKAPEDYIEACVKDEMNYDIMNNIIQWYAEKENKRSRNI